MGYSADSFTAGEQPTTAKWNKLWTNDASFNDGTGIANSVITANKLATGATSAFVAASETTTSTSFADLATTTDTVTVTIGVNGLALVNVSSYIQGSLGNGAYSVGITLSGANTSAAASDRSLMFMAYGNNTFGYYSGSFLYTSLTPGATTFKLKYAASTGTGTFQNRRIGVVPL